MSDSAERHLWLVNHDVPAEVAEEHGAWYLATHIPQLLAVPGIVSGQRFELSPVQSGSKTPELRRYVAVFEIEGDPAVAFAGVREAAAGGRLDPTPVAGVESTSANFVPLAPKQTA